MRRRKPKHYHCYTWQQSFWIMEGFSKDEARKWVAKWGWNVDDHPMYQGKTWWNVDGSGPIIIWTEPVRTLARRMSILAHECIHAAHITLARCGVKPCFDNDEAVTYLTTVLVRKALE